MSCENCEESAYVIDKLAKLLAEIAVIVNGPEPPLTSWSYHDLPEKVRALKQAQQPAAAAVPAVPDGFELNLAVAESAIRKLVRLCPVTPPEAACMKSVVVGARAMLAAANKENNNG